MEIQIAVGVVVGVCTIIGVFISTIQWLVKHYLMELKPNGGASLSDRVTRLEVKLEMIHDYLVGRHAGK